MWDIIRMRQANLLQSLALIRNTISSNDRLGMQTHCHSKSMRRRCEFTYIDHELFRNRAFELRGRDFGGNRHPRTNDIAFCSDEYVLQSYIVSTESSAGMKVQKHTEEDDWKEHRQTQKCRETMRQIAMRRRTQSSMM